MKTQNEERKKDTQMDFESNQQSIPKAL